MNLFHIMADVKPFDVVFDYCIDRCYCQSDCGRFYSHIFWQMLLPLICEMVLFPTILILYYDVTYLADVIANDFVVVDVETTFWTSIYNG